MPALHTIYAYAKQEYGALVRDYSLTGVNAQAAIDQGLASAKWYTTPISKETMAELLERKNGPAIRDTLIWFGLLGLTGGLGAVMWGSLWAILPFAVYGVIYATSSDSRWHESSHGTAFKSDWMNTALYEVSSFMVFRESTPWKWSHARHHSDTIIIGRDPEIALARPTRMIPLILSFTGIISSWVTLKNMLLHATNRLTKEEITYIPESEHASVFWKARVYLLIYFSVFATAVSLESILPLMFIGLPTLYGRWLMPIYGLTQHVGLAENVLDHRLNCRTVHMNLIHRYLYWNMGYHIEHHMFPMVPYHQLPKLHDLIKSDCPEPYSSLWDAWKEIIPAVFLQIDNPDIYVKRRLPDTANPTEYRYTTAGYTSVGEADKTGWIEVNAKAPKVEDVIRFDHDGLTYAIYRTQCGNLYGTEGICTHGNTHLADGLVKGDQVECPKHNGRFNIKDGSCQRSPVCIPLQTYPVKVLGERLLFQLKHLDTQTSEIKVIHNFRVVSNDNVATYIKELILEPVDNGLDYQPGDYLQFDIPRYENLQLGDIHVLPPYKKSWQNQGTFDGKVENQVACRRNYSIASYPGDKGPLKFNIRLATPPQGAKVAYGIGSSYLFSLKPGDQVSAHGPFGDFHIRETNKEMIYIGGGAGMAPLRSHLSHLFEAENTQRKVSFWYGARSKQELLYQDYFEQLQSLNENLSYNIGLSEPTEDDQWSGPTGYIHDILDESALKKHPSPSDAEYYLCGPPLMMAAVTSLLDKYGVPASSISCDTF
ncbi:MAG: NADH:ubiquinone reductase (Na(+)-transporting) subunit F [Oceanospirillaceae bacterium]|nr:NADH:ubiquinone reductase (Na(+)-transporting) subunit F [Oceanospirillaceae bacterium]